MPPSQRSTSSRSAHKESSEIAVDQNYTLGEYSFRVERSAGTSPNYDKIEAICTKGRKNARKSIQIPSTYQYNGYYVEANGTTADIYAILGVPSGEGAHTSSLVDNIPINASSSGSGIATANATWTWSGGLFTFIQLYVSDDSAFYHQYAASTEFGTEVIGTLRYNDGRTVEYIGRTVYDYTYNGKTVYYFDSTGGGFVPGSVSPISPTNLKEYSAAKIAWSMIYGSIVNPEYERKETLVGRFEIELEDAGGAGTESDWSDPGDFDYDDYPNPDERDPEDPTYTLNLEVVGALSGRHNDPLEDTSYSYIPADKTTVKDYGCGGDGGNGGGGGAGASSIVVYKFPTNRADSKEITAIAKRHGYGSGGGKGGKGGDGCILIYY